MKKLLVLTENELSEVVGGGAALVYTVMVLGQVGVVCGVGFALYKGYQLYQKHQQYKKEINDKLDRLIGKVDKVSDKE